MMGMLEGCDAQTALCQERNQLDDERGLPGAAPASDPENPGLSHDGLPEPRRSARDRSCRREPGPAQTSATGPRAAPAACRTAPPCHTRGAGRAAAAPGSWRAPEPLSAGPG